MKRSVRVLAVILLVAMVAGMFPTFAIAEEATKGITLEKDTYEVGEDIIVNAVGTGADWVALYLKDDVIGATADGGVPAIHWYYAEQYPTLNIKDADRHSAREDSTLKDIPAGEYKIVLLENDGYHILDQKDITVVPCTDPNAFEEEETFDLAGGQGNPFPAHAAGQSFAVRYNIGSNRRLASVNLHSIATYAAACQQITYRVYQWDTDYNTTVAGTALYTLVEKDHADCAGISVSIPCELNLTGDLLFVITCDLADAGITPWMANNVNKTDAVFFDNGTESSAFCISLKTAKALPKMEPTYIIDFTDWCEDVNAAYGFNEKVGNEVEYSKALTNGYVTFKASKKDPYVWIRNGSEVTGLYDIPASDLSYVVVKYRTNYDDPTGEGNVNQGINLYAKVKDGEGETGWKSAAAPAINDSFWHTAVIDGSEAWGAYDAPLTLFRLDPLEASNGDGIIGKEADIAYIAFFQNKEAAEQYAAAENNTVALKGELNWGDPAVLCVDGGYYTGADLQVLGEDANLNGFRLLDADGKDTGMTVITTDDGRKVAMDYLIPLTYRDPLDGALEIDGKKYTYEQKIAVSLKYSAIDPEDNSVVSNDHLAVAAVAGMSPDTFYIGETIVKDGSAHDYISQNLDGKIRDTARAYESVGFRGWAKSNDSADVEITEYGYALNDGEIVWSADWIEDGADVRPIVGGNTTRYRITIDMTALEDGWYNVYLFVKDNSGSIYRLNVWGDFRIVKGGDLISDHYEDNEGNSYALDSLIYTEDEQDYVLLGTTDVTDGVSDDQKGKYTYDTEVSYVNAPKAPVDPATVIPVYVLDGTGLNPSGDKMRIDDTEYDYAKGYIRYTANGGDPNSGSTQIPAGTTVAPFMVLKYRTEVECKGEVFTGTTGGAIGASNVPFPSAYIADGEWHYMVVDLRQSSDYDANTNIINHFRNDFVQGSGEWVEIEYYAFFDSYDKADYYGAHDLHELPQPPKTFKATFVDEDGTVIKEIEFREGATKLTGIPKPPSKEGYTSKWETYTLADADITIKVVYTAKATEPATEPATDPATEPVTDPATEPTTDPTTEPVTDPATDAETDPATETDSAIATDATETKADDEGCSSVVVASGAAVLMAAVAAAVALRKKED